MALRSFLTLLAMEERDEVLVLALGLDSWEVDVMFVVFSVALAVAMSAALVDEADDATVSLVVSAFLLVPSSSKDASALSLLLLRLTEAKLTSSTPVGESALIRSTWVLFGVGLLGVVMTDAAPPVSKGSFWQYISRNRTRQSITSSSVGSI